MSWWPKKPDPPKRNVVPFPLFGKDKALRELADRPEVLEQLRKNGDRELPKVKRATSAPLLDTPETFIEADFDTADDVLRKVRKDIRMGLINPTSCMVVMYVPDRECMIWYQKGFRTDDEMAAFEEWMEVIAQ